MPGSAGPPRRFTAWLIVKDLVVDKTSKTKEFMLEIGD
jgi:hypothetical protein